MANFKPSKKYASGMILAIALLGVSLTKLVASDVATVSPNGKAVLAIVEDNAIELSKILKSGTDANSVIDQKFSDGSRLTLLMLAGRKAGPETLLVMLKAGADVEQLDGSKRSVVWYIAEQGSADTFEALNRNADISPVINIADTVTGETPLHKAVLRQNLKIALQLVKAGADIEKKNIIQMTPLEVCKAAESSECEALVIK